MYFSIVCAYFTYGSSCSQKEIKKTTSINLSFKFLKIKIGRKKKSRLFPYRSKVVNLLFVINNLINFA